MLCLECDNCRKGDSLYYCAAKNEFVVMETEKLKERHGDRWRKGSPSYEEHRRQIRKDNKVPQMV